MFLPSLRIAIPTIFLIWCIVGVYIHGPVMLAYPAMWLAVGILFLCLSPLLKSRSAPSSDDAA